MTKSDYSTTIAAIIEQAKIREDALPIRNEKCRSQFFFHPHPTPKVCLFFHGFTAAPISLKCGRKIRSRSPNFGIFARDDGNDRQERDIQVRSLILVYIRQSIYSYQTILELLNLPQ